MPTTIRVFDPAMCCSTGVCGPSVDPQLVRFAADLDWLERSGVSVERFNLSQQPAAFVEHVRVREALEAKGESALPLVLVDGEVKSAGTYPSRQQLAEWAGVAASAPSLFTAAVSELVAIGAAIASNCEPCFRYHYSQARQLGVSTEDLQDAVILAQKVKDTPARAVLELAERYLGPDGPPPEAAPTSCEPDTKAATGCCGSKGRSGRSRSKCC